MAIWLKIKLRTKTTSYNVEASEVEPRELVFGNNENCLYIKDPQNNLHRFASIDDTSQTEYNTWSASKIASMLMGGDTSGYYSKDDLDAMFPSNKGELMGHDGTNVVAVSAGSNGQILKIDNSQPSGFSWSNPNFELDVDGDIQPI